jgi:hypothetical protein
MKCGHLPVGLIIHRSCTTLSKVVAGVMKCGHLPDDDARPSGRN